MKKKRRGFPVKQSTLDMVMSAIFTDLKVLLLSQKVKKKKIARKFVTILKVFHYY